MICRCGGTMHLEHRDILGKWGPDGHHVIVKAVPIWVCDRCGEEVLERDVSREVEELLRSEPAPGDKTERVTVRTFASKQHA
jgi:YgiT-type zinc finger domain-containing protein